MAKKSDEVAPIIIKKVKKGGGAHHGGAWKVAYADFVTAMMAFFLLLWLLNVTTTEQKNAISNYFDPSAPKVSQSQSGAGGVMGGLSITSQGAMTTNVQDLPKPSTGKSAESKGHQNFDKQAKMKQELRAKEDARFKKVKQEIEAAVKNDKALAKHLLVDITPEGLRIQIIDQNGDPMFPSGSAQMYDKTKKLMGEVADLILTLPNQISIRGHTDAHPYPGNSDYTNWELSADRANATRRILEAHKIPNSRIANVMGKAATEPFIPKDPMDARNRRISILLMREKLKDAIKRGEFGIQPLPPDESQTGQDDESTDMDTPAVPAYQKTQGKVQFP